MTPTNGGLGMSMLYPLDSTANITSGTISIRPSSNKAPLLIAASTKNIKSGRHVCGGHYKEALEPFLLPEQHEVYNGKIDRPRFQKSFRKKQIDTLTRGISGCDGYLRNQIIEHGFPANITDKIASCQIIDTSASKLNGFVINMPARAMTGYNWTADDATTMSLKIRSNSLS